MTDDSHVTCVATTRHNCCHHQRDDVEELASSAPVRLVFTDLPAYVPRCLKRKHDQWHQHYSGTLKHVVLVPLKGVA